MTTPGQNNTSQTARLMVDPPGFAIGWQEPIYLPPPGAGNLWSHTVDGRYFERLILATWTFTASAVVANRFLGLSLLDSNGNTVTSVPASGAVAASTSLITNLQRGGPAYDFGTAGQSYGFVPDLLVPPGWKWAMVASGLDVGDVVSGIFLVVQKFPNDAAMITAGQ